MKTMTPPSGQNGDEKSVKGFFSQYVPRPGNQYYRDLAGNIKQVSRLNLTLHIL